MPRESRVTDSIVDAEGALDNGHRPISGLADVSACESEIREKQLSRGSLDTDLAGERS
jgi:hypothetical protein